MPCQQTPAAEMIKFPSPTIPPASASTLTNYLHWSSASKENTLTFFESRGSNGNSLSMSDIHLEEQDPPRRSAPTLQEAKQAKEECHWTWFTLIFPGPSEHSPCSLFMGQNGSRHYMGSDTSVTRVPSLSTSGFIQPLYSPRSTEHLPGSLFCFREVDQATMRARVGLGWRPRLPLCSLGRANQAMPECSVRGDSRELWVSWTMRTG